MSLTFAQIARTPGLPSERICRDGDVITIGIPGSALAYDLSGVADGGRATFDDGPFAGPITRTGGEIVATVILGHASTEAPGTPTVEPAGAFTAGQTLTPDTIETAEEIAAAALAAWRAGAQAYRRAVNQALAAMDVTGTLATTYPGATDMMEAVTLAEADSETPASLVAARRDIIIYQRAHPDVAGIRDFLGWTDAQIDALFEAAMAIEAGG